jgi:hypothetical protein
MGVILLLMLMQTDWVTVLRPLEKQVPRIEIQVGEAMGVCSGVVINAQAGFVLSAAHCFEGKAEDLNIAINGRHAEMVKMNKLLDLAVLRWGWPTSHQRPGQRFAWRASCWPKNSFTRSSAGLPHGGQTTEHWCWTR